MKRRLIHVDAPHFCSGLIVSKQTVVTNAAPILAWAIGNHWKYVESYLNRKGYKLMETEIKEET